MSPTTTTTTTTAAAAAAAVNTTRLSNYNDCNNMQLVLRSNVCRSRHCHTNKCFYHSTDDVSVQICHHQARRENVKVMTECK
jgi:hypothetical protein